MKIITLVRHGQASFGQQNYDKLSPLGIAQTCYLGETYARQQRSIDTLISGTMQRQIDSLSHFLDTYQFCQPTHFSPNSAFDEFNHELVLYRAGLGFNDKMGLLTYLAKHPQPDQAFIEAFSSSLQRWQGGRFNSDYEETWQAFKRRTWQGLQDTVNQVADNSQTLIFTSGGVIATLVQQILGLKDSHSQAFIWQVANASTTQIGWHNERFYLRSFNEYGYLFEKGNTMVTWR